MLLCKCVPVVTLDVLQTAEDAKDVGRLTNLAKPGYFSAVLSFLQKSTDPASCFYAGRSHSCNWIHPKHPPPLQLADPGLLWMSGIDYSCNALKL